MTLVTSFGLDGDGTTIERIDRVRWSERCASTSSCDPNTHGFPGGMCTAKCTERSRENGAICTRIPHHGFERACFQPDVRPEDCIMKPGEFALALLRSCSRTEACRDDYVCARMPNVPLDQGACAPPYLLSRLPHRRPADRPIGSRGLAPYTPGDAPVAVRARRHRGEPSGAAVVRTAAVLEQKLERDRRYGSIATALFVTFFVTTGTFTHHEWSLARRIAGARSSTFASTPSGA